MVLIAFLAFSIAIFYGYGSLSSNLRMLVFRKSMGVVLTIAFSLTIFGPIPVGYYYIRNKVLAHHTHGLIKADDNINVNWFRWWPVKRAQLALYLANPGGAIHFPPNYTETLAADLTLKSNVMLFCDGPCIFTQNAFIVKAPSGTHDFGFTCPFIHSATPAVNSGCTFQSYNGTAASWSIGDSSGFTINFYLRGISMSLDTGAGASAQGLLLTNVTNSDLEYLWVTMGGFSGQQAISTNGTGAFFTGLINISGLECNSSITATNNTCLFIGAITNSINVYGGHANMGGSTNGSTCADVNGTASSGLVLLGFDCDVAQTGVKVESTANTAVWGFMRGDSGLTNTAAFGTGSNGNMLYTNANLPFTDTGTAGTNSVINPGRNNWRTDVLQNQVQATFAVLLKDLTDSGNGRLILTYGAGGQTRINGGSGAGMVYSGFDFGTGGLGVCNGTGAATSCVRFQSAAATSEKIVTLQNSGGTMPIEVASGTATFTTTAVAAAACQTVVTVAATNTLTTDTISWAFNSAPVAATDASLITSVWPTAGNVNFKRCNPTAASITPTALVANWRVIR